MGRAKSKSLSPNSPTALCRDCYIALVPVSLISILDKIVKSLNLLLFCIVPMTTFCQVEQHLQSPQGVTQRMLEIISGPQGKERAWEEYRNLFLPRAQKIMVTKNEDGTTRVRVMNIEEFIRNVGPYYARDGFEEYVIGLEIDEFNGIAQVFQTFYCRNLIGTYENRGINSYQCIYADGRWWIASTMFTNESTDSPLPEKYLFKK